MSRSLDDLHPWVKAKAEALLQRAAAQDIRLLVTQTRRTPAEQDTLYAQGRTAPGKIVTNAKGGETPHNFGLAFDAIPVDERGNPIWDTPPTVWRILYRIAEEVGLDALGDRWGEYVSWDPGHFQEPGWRVVKALT